MAIACIFIVIGLGIGSYSTYSKSGAAASSGSAVADTRNYRSINTQASNNSETIILENNDVPVTQNSILGCPGPLTDLDTMAGTIDIQIEVPNEIPLCLYDCYLLPDTIEGDWVVTATVTGGYTPKGLAKIDIYQNQDGCGDKEYQGTIWLKWNKIQDEDCGWGWMCFGEAPSPAIWEATPINILDVPCLDRISLISTQTPVVTGDCFELDDFEIFDSKLVDLQFSSDWKGCNFEVILAHKSYFP